MRAKDIPSEISSPPTGVLMSQAFGYLTSDDTLTALVMARIGDQFQAIAPADRSGLGLGWMQNGQSLLRKHPHQRAAAVDIAPLIGDLPSRTIVGHISAPSVDSLTAAEMQPFRYRNWLYTQSGLTSSDMRDEAETLARRLRAEIPDHIRRNIQGKSLAEVIFHLFFTRHEANFVPGPAHLTARHDAATLAATMLHVEEHLRDSKVKGAPGVHPFVAIAATNKLLVAASIDEPLHYRFFDGIDQPAEKPLFAGHRPRPVHHGHFKGLVVANKIADPTGWQELPNRHILWVEPQWKIRTAPLEHVGKNDVK